jgi:hypothetical protein
MDEMIEELCAGTGWHYIDDVTLECPCGELLEHDAACDECGPNPLQQMGLI